MELELRQEFAEEPDLRHQVRRLRWFKKTFRRDAELIAHHHNVELAIEDRRLTQVFLNWIEAFNRRKTYASLDRRDFTLFAAGLLLREFIKSRPVSAQAEASRAGGGSFDRQLLAGRLPLHQLLPERAERRGAAGIRGEPEPLGRRR